MSNAIESQHYLVRRAKTGWELCGVYVVAGEDDYVIRIAPYATKKAAIVAGRLLAGHELPVFIEKR